MHCHTCGSDALIHLGTLGTLDWFRCQSCGVLNELPIEQEDEPMKDTVSIELTREEVAALDLAVQMQRDYINSKPYRFWQPDIHTDADEAAAIVRMMRNRLSDNELNDEG